MQVSIVICTLNRAESLAQTLESLRYQRYEHFEVVVVNGPSTDHTEEVLASWSHAIKIDRCPVPNLSVSRNIGIRAAAGDVVAFIDDDALPEFDWLVEAVGAFDADDVAGVGGIVFDHTGMDLQYRFSAANRFAESTSRLDAPYDDLCFPGSFKFPYLQGTNALFRRSALLEVGGFDEEYEYYLDETDLCCRLVDAGYRLRQLATAPVHHKFLPSGIRDHQRIVTNWFPIMKNQAYFSYRHALGAFSEFDILEHSRAFLQSRVEDALHHELAGRLPPGTANRAAIICAQALTVGTEIGRQRQSRRLGPVEWHRPSFKRFPTIDACGRRRLVFVSSGYTPHLTGGISRFISDLCPALVRRGHEVRVITRSNGHSAVDLEDGVWVHRISASLGPAGGVVPGTFRHVDEFATAALLEIERISGWSDPDLVYGPLWDVEVLGVLRRSALPVVVQVATPLAIAAPLAGHGGEPLVHRLVELEHEVLDHADLFHANSRAVDETISTHYASALDHRRWGVVHLGLSDRTGPDVGSPVDDLGFEGTVVLFVGRFESRKGIDTFLDAIPGILRSHDDVEVVAVGEDRPLAPHEPLFGEQWSSAHQDEPWISRIHFTGEVDDERLDAHYARADVVVLPSRYESFGLVMAEAMMHGKPVVSCDTSGVREVVRSGVDGILVAPGDVAALAAAIELLTGDAASRTRFGAAGRERFLAEFHIDRFAERFENFLERVRFHDVTEASIDGASSRTLASPRGRLTASLSPGDMAAFDAVPGTLGSVCITAEEPSVVVVRQRHDIPHRLLPGVVHRLSIDDAPLEVRVVSGSVLLHGVIRVRSNETGPTRAALDMISSNEAST